MESGGLLTGLDRNLDCGSDDGLTGSVNRRYAISDEASLMESAVTLSALHESERKATTAQVQPKFGETRERRGKTKGRN